MPLLVGALRCLLQRGESPRSAEQIESIHDAVVNAIGARCLDQVDLDTHVTVHEVDFLPAFAGPGVVRPLNRISTHLLDTYGPHLQNLLGVWYLPLAIFMVIFLRLLKKFKPSEAEVQILGEDESAVFCPALGVIGWRALPLNC